MIERKNIDRVFQENFKNLEIEPGKKVWENIEVALNENHYKKTISLWQRLSGVAMILILFLTGGIWFTNSNAERSSINRITNTDNNNFNTDNVIPINRDIKKDKSIIVQADQKNIKKKSLKKNTPVFVKKPNNDVIVTTTDISSVYKNIENKYIIDKNDFIEALKSDSHVITQIESEKEAIVLKNVETKKWSVGPTVSPIYYNSLQNGSPINESLSNNKITTDDAFSYGVKINYQLTKKINLQSGINKVEMAYNTEGVNAFIATDKNTLSNTYTTKPGVILTPVVGGIASSSGVNSVSKSGTRGDINQSLEYFELPLEMKYNLYSNKLGFNLVGGFSTYLLTKNSVSLISQNQITDLGGASNLNTINFSGNVGFDLDYKISKSWYFNVTPMFKYQFNTYSNNSGNFKPYYLGVYSGLNYKF